MSELWNELHFHALNYNGTNDWSYLASFGNRIPRYTRGCKCQEHWSAWLRFNAPVFTPTAEYFAWTVKAHNAVNLKLGKPQMSVEEATKIYTEKYNALQPKV